MARAYTRDIARCELLLRIAATVLLAAAAYELAVALEWISMGPRPGDEARGQAAITIAAFAAILVGAAVTPFAARRTRVSRWAASLVLDSGHGFTVWVYGVSAWLLGAAGLALVRARLGLALTPFALVACGVTVLLMGAGH